MTWWSASGLAGWLIAYALFHPLRRPHRRRPEHFGLDSRVEIVHTGDGIDLHT